MDKRRFLIPGIAILLIMLTVSCSEKKNEDTLPELPPVDALMMDFSEFIDDPSQMPALKSMNTYQNAIYSYATVSIWNFLVSVPMIVPVAAYLESFKHTPVYLGDNSWQWSYTVGGGISTYTARLLTTRISNDEFTAEMFVAQVGIAGEFMWFEGTVRYDRTHAEWTMYKSPAENVAWLDIEWNKDWEKETSDITYTVTNGEENGSYITFGITEDTDYDAYYTISTSQKETTIKWHRTGKTGRVKDLVNFGDELWHCWNESYQDVDCY